jgi:branched-chain amino acid transport system substrate-binding protein
MMKRRGMLAGVVLVLGLFFLFWASLAMADEAVKVGIVLPLTGAQAKFGEIEKDSFDMALEEINAAGGINGKKLVLVIEDDTGRPEVGRSVAEKLITKDKVVMIGGGGTAARSPMRLRGSASRNRCRS